MNLSHTTASSSPQDICPEWSSAYPPLIDPAGEVDDHDRPYAEFRHLGNLNCNK